MRTLAVALSLSMLLTASAASAQTPLSGPLASPGVPAAPATDKPVKTKSAHHKAKAKHNTAAPASASGEHDAAPVPVVGSRSGASEDPVSLGMKWNGNNDSAQQTRVQNYNGTATGTGGEVGLNFHF